MDFKENFRRFQCLIAGIPAFRSFQCNAEFLSKQANDVFDNVCRKISEVLSSKLPVKQADFGIPDDRLVGKENLGTTFGKSQRHQGSNKHPRNLFRNEDVQIKALYVAKTKHYIPNIYTFGYVFREWTEYWAILNTGELYLGLPHGDPRYFDYELERRENPDRFVPYQLDGGHVQTFNWSGHDITFRVGDKEVAVEDGTVFHKVTACQNCQLNGTFRHDAYTDIVGTIEAYGLRGSTTFTFHPDGKFEVQGCTENMCIPPGRYKSGVYLKDPRGQTTGPSKNKGVVDDVRELDWGFESLEEQESSGTYEVSDNRLELVYRDGRVEDGFFFRYPGNEENILSINGVCFTSINYSDPLSELSQTKN